MANNEHEIKVKITGQDQASPTLKAAVEKLTESIERLNQTQLAGVKASQAASDGKDKLNSKAINLAAGLTILKTAYDVASLAASKLGAVVGHAINEALEAEKAHNQLIGALVSTGQFTEQATQKLEKYIETVEKSTGANGEQVKSMIAQGVQMGLTIEKAKQLEEAARKLAAAHNIDVQSAFQAVKMSLNGVSRGLGQYVPQVKELSAAALKQGGAIDIVNKALDTQYRLYQSSLPASIDRAKTSVDNVYKSFGQLITQNPLAQKAIGTFIAAMEKLEHAFEATNKFIIENQATIEALLSGFGKAIAVVGAVAAAMAAASGAGAALGAVLAFIKGPIGLAIAAAVALTAAFTKWPGLFDIVVGSVQTLIGVALAPMSVAMGGLIDLIGKAASALGLDWGQALQDASAKILELNTNLIKGGVEQVKYGASHMTAADQVEQASKKIVDANTKALESESAYNAKLRERHQLYAGIDYGTEKEREALEKRVQDRDKELQEFNKYLEAKKRIALTKEEEQQVQLAAIRANALKGTGGSAEATAGAQAEVENEKKKQAELTELRNQRVISEEQFQAAMAASRQRAMQAELTMEQAHRVEKANIMGESEEAYAERIKLAEERYLAEQEIRNQRYEQEKLTEEERRIAELEAKTVHLQNLKAIEDAHFTAVAQREEVTGATITATRQKWFREQEKAQAQAIKNFASGVNMMIAIQQAANQTFAQLGDALIKNQKITASKFVGVFLEMLGRQVQQKGFADLVMGVFPPNPVQLAVGAAEVAAGTAIGRLGVSMQGGQADEGMDEIPGSLAGKSFILSQGERIVQPSANRDLKDFLAREKTGQTTVGGATYNITLNYNGSGGRNDAESMADIVIEEIRKRSERGAPIMSERGLTKA